MGAIANESYAVRYDAYCKRFVDLNPDLDYRMAESPAEREAHFRLRYEQVTSAGWADPADFPDGLECDAYDEHATIINGWHGDQLVITGRLIFPEGRLLPMEVDFGIRVEPSGQLVESGRVVLVHALQNEFPYAFLGLIGASWLTLRARGYSEQGGVMTAPAARLYRLLGIQITRLTEPQLHWGERRAPYKLNLAATVAALERRVL